MNSFVTMLFLRRPPPRCFVHTLHADGSGLTIQFLLPRNFFEEFHRETIFSVPGNVTASCIEAIASQIGLGPRFSFAEKIWGK